MTFRVRLRLKVSPPIRGLLTLVSAYGAAKCLSDSRISTLVFNHGSRVGQIRAGGDIGTRRLARAIQWFSDHWPAEAVWPADIKRPEPAKVAA